MAVRNITCTHTVSPTSKWLLDLHFVFLKWFTSELYRDSECRFNRKHCSVVQCTKLNICNDLMRSNQFSAFRFGSAVELTYKTTCYTYTHIFHCPMDTYERFCPRCEYVMCDFSRLFISFFYFCGLLKTISCLSSAHWALSTIKNGGMKK